MIAILMILFIIYSYALKSYVYNILDENFFKIAILIVSHSFLYVIFLDAKVMPRDIFLFRLNYLNGRNTYRL